jgi:hypothetical protein
VEQILTTVLEEEALNIIVLGHIILLIMGTVETVEHRVAIEAAVHKVLLL